MNLFKRYLKNRWSDFKKKSLTNGIEFSIVGLLLTILWSILLHNDLSHIHNIDFSNLGYYLDHNIFTQNYKYNAEAKKDLVFLGLSIIFLVIGISLIKMHFKENMKKCPFCANDIKNEAIVCQFCGKELLKSGSDEPVTKLKPEQEKVEPERREEQEKKEREERERREAQEKKEREEREERKRREERPRKLLIWVSIIAFITFIVVTAIYFNFSPTQTHNSKSDNNSMPEVDIYKSFTDSRDKKTYKIVTIGNQIWMAENLNYEVKGSECYNHNPENCRKYGRLYHWEPALKACPNGWHLPKDYEWVTLADYVGSDARRKLKSKSGWDSNGTDEYGFSALPSGTGKSDGTFVNFDKYSYWWSIGEGTDAYYRYITPENSNLNKIKSTKKGLFPIRCIQD